MAQYDIFMSRLILALAICLLITACRPTVVIPTRENATTTNTITTSTPITVSDSSWRLPLDRAEQRVTKKPFGILINPKTSPVQPEKFSGYHAGVDFETFTEEAETIVTVQAVCSGKISQVRTSTGYGGVVVQSCLYDNQPVTVVYGHLDIAAVKIKIGDKVTSGEAIGNLGQGYSSQTGGERKHLHLGIYKGSVINIRGYVATKVELDSWLNILDLISIK